MRTQHGREVDPHGGYPVITPIVILITLLGLYLASPVIRQPVREALIQAGGPQRVMLTDESEKQLVRDICAALLDAGKLREGVGCKGAP